MRSTGTRFPKTALAATLIGIVFGVATPALGVIRIDFPVSRVYKEATIVAVCEVAKVSAEGGAECTIHETLKGRLPDAALTVDVSADVAKQLKAGQPVVLFINGDVAVVHIADGWYKADRKGAGRWAISGPYPMVKNYPGRTAGLVAIVRAIKAGKPGIQDGIGHEFVGSLVDRGNLGVRPTFLTAVDVNGDGNLDLVVGTAEGVRLFLAAGEKYTDATEQWGLKDAAGKFCAAGDANGDGKTDLLIGKTLWLREGEKFVKSKVPLELPDEEKWAAVTLGDVDGDRLTDVAVLTRTGELKTAINPGPEARAWAAKSVALWTGDQTALAAAFSRDWGDDGAWYVLVVHPADIVRYPVGAATAGASDFKRLTGIALSDYGKIGPTPIQVDLCTPLDYDGNGHMDLLLVTKGGGITLANRGFGAMMINGFMHTQFRSSTDMKSATKLPKLPFELGPSVFVAPGKRAGRTGKGNAQNLLFLRGDGRLFEMVNGR